MVRRSQCDRRSLGRTSTTAPLAVATGAIAGIAHVVTATTTMTVAAKDTAMTTTAPDDAIAVGHAGTGTRAAVAAAVAVATMTAPWTVCRHPRRCRNRQQWDESAARWSHPLYVRDLRWCVCAWR